MSQCKIITGATSAALETAVNTWLSEEDNKGSGVTIEHISMSEGSAGTAAVKAMIIYTSDWERNYT
ncbi:MAG TPA: hypothetical protein P5136_02710 [Methanofastidiosum sp.]|nr:hypothetical protein [Methanofastidiosum sp.]